MKTKKELLMQLNNKNDDYTVRTELVKMLENEIRFKLLLLYRDRKVDKSKLISKIASFYNIGVAKYIERQGFQYS